jgi:FkbM family methyltransferase
MNDMSQSTAQFLPERLTFAKWLCRALPPILSHRLATRVFLRKRPQAGNAFVTTTITGALFSLRSGDILGDQVRQCGYWDWKALAIAKFFCKSGDTIIEVGANTGTETVGFAQIVGPKGKVIAFEPLPQLADAHRHNSRINGFAHVQTIEAAVTDFDGSVRIQPPASSTNSGQGYITSDNDASGFTVPAMRIDSMIDKLGPAELILIDVEGHEVSVLRGADEYIRQHRPVLIVEAIASQLKRAGSSLQELSNQLTGAGYTLYSIDRTSVAPLDLGAMGQINWLCLPSERSRETQNLNRYLATCAFMPNFVQPLKMT